MKLRDVRDVVTWMLGTAVVTVGLFGTITAHSADPFLTPVEKETTVDGCKVTTKMVLAQDRSVANVTLSIENSSPSAKWVNVPVNLVDVQFTGDPMSRLPSDDDYKRTTVNSAQVRVLVSAGKSVARTLTLSTTRNSVGNSLMARTPNYTIIIGQMQPDSLPGLSKNNSIMQARL